MKTLALGIAILILVRAAAAQQVPPPRTMFKDVYIGEPASEFFVPVLAMLNSQAGWDACIALQKDRDKQQRNAKGKCGEAFTQLKRDITDKIAGKAGNFPSGTNTAEMQIMYTFADGKLSQIDVTFFPHISFWQHTSDLKYDMVTSFDQQVANLTEKYGVPSSTQDVPYQNAYGAQYKGYRTIWTMPDQTHIRCELIPGTHGQDDIITVVFSGQLSVSEAAQAEKNRKATNPY